MSTEPHPYHHTVTRHVGPDGRRCKSTDPGAQKVQEETATYYADLPPLIEGGKPERVSLHTTDVGAAWVELRERLKKRKREAEGIADPLLGQVRKPLVEHVEDWLAEVKGRGTSVEQVKLLRSRVLKLASLATWERLPQITTSSALAALGLLAGERCRGMQAGETGRGAQTRNHYLSALHQFVGWCLDEERLARDPLRKARGVPIETDLRHVRRSPTDQEVGQLMAYLEGDQTVKRCRMSGPQRGLGYRVSMATGFRAKELRHLERHSFDLAEGTVIVPAAYSKRHRNDRQHLPHWLVLELQVWLASNNKLWSDFPDNWPGRVLLADQAACGVAHVVQGQDGADRFFDFHSLRVWFCTFTANHPGISPKTLLTMCRHSDPRLTLQVYAKTIEDEIRTVANAIPRIGGKKAAE